MKSTGRDVIKIYFKMFKLASLLLLLCHGINSQNYYTAAVYEYTPSSATSTNPESLILLNINNYKLAAERAHAQNVDIIVFPEYGLTSFVDDPTNYAIAINPDHYTFDKLDNKYLQELGNIARGHDLYLVVNLLEREDTNNNKTTHYYNTNIVFDKKGNIIAKYRKINLSDEPELTPGNETVTFTTDFGVKFGMFICNDILYRNPARDIFNDTGVTDIVYSSAWFNTLPFFGALSIQQGYAAANNINLLASTYNNASHTNGGSGIYLANGKIAEVYIEKAKLIVQNVTKMNRRTDPAECNKRTPSSRGLFGTRGLIQSNISNFITTKNFHHEQYKFASIDLSKSSQSTTLCQSGFCCTFNFSIEEPNNSEIYKLMVFDGSVQRGDRNDHIRVCTLLACKDNMESSCGERINGTTKFTKFSVDGNLNLDQEFYYQPLSLNFNLEPIDETWFCNVPDENGKKTYVKLSKAAASDQVLVFGIFGKSSASVNTSEIIVFLVFSVVQYLFF